MNIIISKINGTFEAKCVENNITAKGKTIKQALDNLTEELKDFYKNDELEIEFENISLWEN